MLRKALNIHWSSYLPNQQLYAIDHSLLLYGELPAVSNKIASRRLQLAGHCYRHPELSTQKLVLWEPTHGHRGRGRPKTTYIDTLKRDTGAFEACEIVALMSDKSLWKDLEVARLRATKWVSECELQNMTYYNNYGFIWPVWDHIILSSYMYFNHSSFLKPWRGVCYEIEPWFIKWEKQLQKGYLRGKDWKKY